MESNPISRLGLSDLSPSADRHEWLLQTEDATVDPIQSVGIIREYLDTLPATSGTFTRKDLVEFAEQQGMEDVTTGWFRDVFLWLADCWQIPPHYNMGSKRRRWINPEYAHREQYSPVTVKCECGGIVTKIKDSGSGYGVETEHEDDCYPGWQTHAAGILMENRRVLLTRFALLAKSSRQNHDLLHCGKNQVSHYVKSCGVDVQAMKKIGMNQRNNTFVELARRGYSAREIANVYGFSASHVREVIATETPHSLQDLKP